MSKYFDEKVNVVNLAESGRSSKSYVTDSAANYSTYKNGIKKGDYVIIAFGHNDEKLEAERYTNPNTGLDDPTSFQSVIYNNYVKPALDVGATPIICTPIVRRTTGTFSASQLHNTTGTSAVVDGVTLTGGDYVAAGKALAEAYNLTCIDMTELTKNLYTELTPDETINLHAWTSKSSSSVDNTHLNVYGADVVAYLCTQAIKNSTSTLSARVLDGAVMPDKAETLVPNPDYKEAEYTAPQASTKWSDVGSWTGTVFGDVGGASKINATNFNLSAAETGSTDAMNIRAGVFTSDTEATGYGKLSSTAEGIAMYYRAVPSNKNFTITAKATINKLVTHDQVSFGLMARDAVWTDNYTKDSLGDYVAAGSLYATKAASGSMWANFCRKSGTLTKGLNSTKTEAYKPGDVVELKISKNDDGYACTIDGQSVSAGFDFQLTAIDSDYVYVGPYVARAADVTFSDVTLTIND
jgi:lysophospholipase L1-like esterase